MRITNRIRGILRLSILSVILMMIPLPSCPGLPVITEAYAFSYFDIDSYFSFDDDYQEKESGPQLNKSALWMKTKKTRKLKLLHANGTVKWSSSNKKVAKVSSKGLVTAKKAGKAVITAKCGNPAKSYKCTVNVYSQASVKKKLMKLKSKKKYKEGRYWTNESEQYYWAADNLYGAGCYALIGIFSDYVFGTEAPIKKHSDFSKIKAGDHIRIGGTHSVIVLEKKGDKLTIVEGNYNSSVHWGRVLTKRYLQSTGFFVDTRYW